MSGLPLPEITPLNEPYWAALRGGELVFQSCACGDRWLPPRPDCPSCLQPDRWSWRPASGKGRVVSWVVYHIAYHPAFADRLPYNVAIVELAEGPRLITNIGAPNADLRGGMPVALAVSQVDGVSIATFVCSATIWVRGRIASPEMLLDIEVLPHLICSPGRESGRHGDEEGQHGDEAGAGGGDRLSISGRRPTREEADFG